MKIGILGSGDVDQASAKAFCSEDHDVMIDTHNVKRAKAKELAKQAVELWRFV